MSWSRIKLLQNSQTTEIRYIILLINCAAKLVREFVGWNWIREVRQSLGLTLRLRTRKMTFFLKRMSIAIWFKGWWETAESQIKILSMWHLWSLSLSNTNSLQNFPNSLSLNLFASISNTSILLSSIQSVLYKILKITWYRKSLLFFWRIMADGISLRQVFVLSDGIDRLENPDPPIVKSPIETNLSNHFSPIFSSRTLSISPGYFSAYRNYSEFGEKTRWRM